MVGPIKPPFDNSTSCEKNHGAPNHLMTSVFRKNKNGTASDTLFQVTSTPDWFYHLYHNPTLDCNASRNCPHLGKDIGFNLGGRKNPSYSNVLMRRNHERTGWVVSTTRIFAETVRRRMYLSENTGTFVQVCFDPAKKKSRRCTVHTVQPPTVRVMALPS